MAVVQKTTLNLPEDELGALTRLAEQRGVSRTQAFRQAIQTELFLQGLVDQGGRVLVQLPDGELQQLVFAQMQTSKAGQAAATS